MARGGAAPGMADGLAGLAGEVLQPGDVGYAVARRVWNGAIDRSPLAVVRCRTAEEVSRTVSFARDAGLPLAVRGGGHGLPGFGTCDDGIVLDLSQMRSISVDAERRIATVGGGALWRDYDAATHAHGLAGTGGMVSTTGVAGLTLGGGVGWLARRCGLACDNLVGATLVMADGTIRHVDSRSAPDLLWALRGGGGNFGVVLALELRLHRIADVTAGMAFFPATRLREVAAFYRDYIRATPDDVTTMFALQTAPEEPEIPEPLWGTLVAVIGACHAGDPAEAQAALAPILALGPAAGAFELQPYPDWQQIFDADMAAGRRTYARGGFTSGLPDGMIDAIETWMSARPSDASELDLHEMGGAVGRVADDETAFADRHSPLLFNILTRWDDPRADERNRTWARAFAADLRRFGTGRAYVNFVTDTERPAELREIYGDARYRRLRDLKRRYDPDNLFRLNQNVLP